MAQIEIQNLSFFYPNEISPAVENVSLKIHQGEYVVLCGRSGSGKSTLLRSLKPVLRPYGKVEGSVFFENCDLEQVSEAVQAKKIGFVMQSVEHQLVTDKVWHELSFGLENLGCRQQVIQARVAEIAEYFGITDWLNNCVSRLSGGQKQLLNLASVMVFNPDILIMDEPTAQLDPIAAERFLEMVQKINQDFGITVLLSEHSLGDVLQAADRLGIMEHGKLIDFGAVTEVLQKNRNRELIKLMPDCAQIFYQVEHDLNQEVPISVKQGRNWLKQKAPDLRTESPVSFGAPKQRTNQKSEQAVRCSHIWFRYERTGRDIIEDLSFQVNRGEIYAVLGGNGTGKTTAMSVLAGVYKAYRGRMKINGKTSLLPQDVQTLFCKDTVGEELEEVPQNIQDFVQLQELLQRHPYDLSGGQQQKLGLAKVLASGADILLLDEPTKGLDGFSKEQMGKMLKELKNRDKTIILVSHDIDFCGAYADRCGLFAMGRMVSEGTVQEFFCENRFYITTIRKMTEGIVQGMVNKEELRCFLAGETAI